MSVLKAGETVKAKRPIEDLAERLPSIRLEELTRITEAGQKREFGLQLQLLDGLRRDVSSEVGNPKNELSARENYKRALDSINLMRGMAQENLRGVHNDAAVSVSQNVSAIPPAMGKPLSQITELSMNGRITGLQAEQVATFLSRVEVCAKRGVFDVIPRFTEQFAKEMREANAIEANPVLGRLASCADNVGTLAKELSQKIHAGVDISGPARANDTVEGPAHAAAARALSKPATGIFLMERLRDPSADKDKKRILGLS